MSTIDATIRSSATAEPEDILTDANAEPGRFSVDSGSCSPIDASPRPPSSSSADLTPEKADGGHDRATQDNFAGFPFSFAGVDFSQCIAILGKPFGLSMASRNSKDEPPAAPADHSFADTSVISDSPNALQPTLTCSEPSNINDIVLHRGTIQRQRRRIPQCSPVVGRRSEDDEV